MVNHGLFLNLHGYHVVTMINCVLLCFSNIIVSEYVFINHIFALFHQDGLPATW